MINILNPLRQSVARPLPLGSSLLSRHALHRFGTISRPTKLNKYAYSTSTNTNATSTSIKTTTVTASKNVPPTVARGKVKSNKRRYYNFFRFGIAIGLGATALYYTNEKFRHAILTIKRVNVVTVAMVRCFALYKEVLDRKFDTPQERSQELSRTHKKAAEITLKALEKNGGIYIKLGQHITALTYLLPREWTDTMIPLQDQCPRSSVEEIESMFESDLGVSLSDIFSEFDPTPIGVASLAQVHIARLKSNGQKVAVKVQHPSLKEFVPVDVEMTKLVFDLMYKAFPEYPLTWLGDELQNSIFVELDFTKEAENAQRTAKHFKDYPVLRIPKIIEAKNRILIMECVSGSRLDNLTYLKEHDIDPSKVSACLSHIFNDMIFTPDVGLHCDPHGGNLAIRSVQPTKNSRDNFEIILYDHGLYRDIPLQMKRDYSHFWLAVLDNNIPEMKKYTKKLAGIDGEQKFKIFISAITGRSPEAILSDKKLKKKRSIDEINDIQSQLNDSQSGVLEDLMDILSSVPRMILLILKTNDLTRSLDECLHTDLGPERTFLIMANYCAKSVYNEGIDTINSHCRGLHWALKRMGNWFQYCHRLTELYFYDFALQLRQLKLRYL
ncbi:hypothetical protein PVL30_004639 [Lodderomyces elongisporus]|uniref:uncharacterized protein n=1 Tax=Lodderomyces elongisporus TaxID=36914 RepID=UPI002925C4E8|nr:uncharacterized protein PVL30_004639 [Lodderomyces elongisporus]WLF80849.1 hypothetical protein PVL30_004639 [Lodderomyces elongisporus]